VNIRSYELAVESSLLQLMEVMREWCDMAEVERGVMFCPTTYEVLAEGDSVWALRNAVIDHNIPSESSHGEVRRYPGVFSVSRRLIDATEGLNAAKHWFERCVREAEHAGLDRNHLRRLYRLAGYPRLHPKQAMRQLCILSPDNLQSIGFTLAKNTAASSVVQTHEAIERLINFGQQDIASMVSASGVQSVRWHLPISPHIRANVVWGKKDDRVSRMLYASLPFLLPEGAWPERRVRFNKPRHHARRSDYSIDNSIPLPFREGAYLTLLQQHPTQKKPAF